MAPRVAQAPTPQPAAAQAPAAETPPALPTDMPARVNSQPAAPSAPAASAPAAASTPAASADVPPPASRPGAPGPKYNDLMSAVLNKDVDGVNELLAFGKWADKGDSRGVTPLMIAVRYGDAASAEALLKAGADPNRNAAGGENAMKIAAANRDAAMTALLERYKKP
jgi:ankyrin repeat protein